MGMWRRLQRWLDPPETIARKRLMRAAGVRPPGASLEVGVLVPVGCLVPLALAIVVLVGASVLVGTHLGASSAPDHVVVRVIDDGAKGGPAVLSTQVVPLR